MTIAHGFDPDGTPSTGAQIALSSKADVEHGHAPDAEGIQDVVGAMVVAAGGTYDDEAGTITLPSSGGGGGVTATDTPAKPAEGTSASYLVTSAVTWPAGLVWSTDPDGGTAPTISGTALVSFFTLDGVTRAVMGATFPGSGTTTTTTSAGTTTTTTSAGTTTTTTTEATTTTFFTDFSEYATATGVPSGWTPVWGSPAPASGVFDDAAATGGKVLRLVSSSTRVALTVTSLGTVTNQPVEVVTRFKLLGTNPAANPARIFASGTLGSENTYSATATATAASLAKIVNGTQTALGSPASISLAVGDWAWMRARVDNGDLKLRFWADGASEPSTWSVETTDSSLTSGGVGIGAYKDIEYDIVGIAVGGGTAPTIEP